SEASDLIVTRRLRETTAEVADGYLGNHEMGFARRVADRVVFMADGEVVETATPAAFFDSPASDRARDFLAKVLSH
ncbi:amino acid ABC transporter ATP-binding protein, partial [Actinomadura sp. NPDC048032]